MCLPSVSNSSRSRRSGGLRRNASFLRIRNHFWEKFIPKKLIDPAMHAMDRPGLIQGECFFMEISLLNRNFEARLIDGYPFFILNMWQKVFHSPMHKGLFEAFCGRNFG